MTHLPLRATLAASLATALLAGCGGDSDSTSTPPPATSSNELPASATASGAALEAFAIGLAPSETAEPLQLDTVSALPASETDEPIAVN